MIERTHFPCKICFLRISSIFSQIDLRIAVHSFHDFEGMFILKYSLLHTGFNHNNVCTRPRKVCSSIMYEAAYCIQRLTPHAAGVEKTTTLRKTK